MMKTVSAAIFILAAAVPAAQAQTVATPANESFISQIGDSNTATVSQTGGGNTQTTLQGVTDSTALAKLPNSSLLTLGQSLNNLASTTQLANPTNGGSNTSMTIQLGAGSNVSGVLQAALAGGSNDQLTIQSGFGNIANTMQVAHAGLTSTSTTLQVGSHNTVTVSQK